MATILKNRNFLEGMNTAQAEIYNWEDVAQRAKLYLDTVREQAHQLLADAKIEADKLRQQATSNGLEQGQQRAAADAQRIAEDLAQKQVADAFQNVHHLTQELERATEAWLRQWQHETVPLAIAIAEKLIARQIDTDPEILLNWIRETVRLAQASSQYRLHLHPQAIANLQPALDQLLNELNRNRPVHLVEDESLDPRGVVLETNDGQIDMQLTSQLERLREELL